MKSCQSPDIRFPSMASFFFWQLKQRKGPSQGRGFLALGAPSCTEIPSPGLISTWHTAHMNNLNMLQSGYFVSNLQFIQRCFHVKRDNWRTSCKHKQQNQTFLKARQILPRIVPVPYLAQHILFQRMKMTRRAFCGKWPSTFLLPVSFVLVQK